MQITALFALRRARFLRAISKRGFNSGDSFCCSAISYEIIFTWTRTFLTSHSSIWQSLSKVIQKARAFDFISGFVGIFLIIYSITEIVNYIFYLVNRKKYSNIFDKEEYDKENKRVKKKENVTKKLKEGKVIEADIEE